MIFLFVNFPSIISIKSIITQKLHKSENYCFIGFTTLRIFLNQNHNLATFVGGGFCMSLIRTEPTFYMIHEYSILQATLAANRQTRHIIAINVSCMCTNTANISRNHTNTAWFFSCWTFIQQKKLCCICMFARNVDCNKLTHLSICSQRWLQDTVFVCYKKRFFYTLSIFSFMQ